MYMLSGTLYIVENKNYYYYSDLLTRILHLATW